MGKIIYETDNWEIVFVDWCQEFIGQCIISTKKNRKSLSELTIEEWKEFGELEKRLELTCKNCFNTTMFNVCFLMNDAYKNNVEPHVHCQFIPRYKQEIVLFNKKYIDKHFGYNLWKWSLSKFKSQKDIFSKGNKQKIFEIMEKEFNK